MDKLRWKVTGWWDQYAGKEGMENTIEDALWDVLANGLINKKQSGMEGEKEKQRE